MDMVELCSGQVTSVAINGESRNECNVAKGRGFQGDKHFKVNRKLGHHDNEFWEALGLPGSSRFGFNYRSWSGLSVEEIAVAEQILGYDIPLGLFGENVRFEGIPEFSELPLMSAIVFPEKKDGRRCILRVTMHNTPCGGIRNPFRAHHQITEAPEPYKAHFSSALLRRRGVCGFPETSGIVSVGDPVRVFRPITF